jgi:hypothetical protein
MQNRPAGPDLAENMLLAQRDRAQRALRDLEYAQQAPALFKPEWTARAAAELEAARASARLWTS